MICILKDDLFSSLGLPRWCSGKESTRQCRGCRRPGFNPWLGKIPWRRKWQPTPAFLPGEFHRQRSLAGYSPRSCKESDTTEHTHIYTSLSPYSVSSMQTRLGALLPVCVSSPPGSSVHGILPGKNIGVGCHSLLQGTFPTQGWNSGLLRWHADSLWSEPPGKTESVLPTCFLSASSLSARKCWEYQLREGKSEEPGTWGSFSSF